MKEYLVLDDTYCINFFVCTNRQDLYIQMFEARIRAVVIRELSPENKH